jgi:hypothetical protein
MGTRIAVAVAGVLIVASLPARAADAAAPSADEDFLEYLGSWDGDDADWQVVAAEPPTAAPAHPKVPTTPDRKQAQATAASGAGAEQEQQP